MVEGKREHGFPVRVVSKDEIVLSPELTATGSW
jgi:hypothetical protein